VLDLLGPPVRRFLARQGMGQRDWGDGMRTTRAKVTRIGGDRNGKDLSRGALRRGTLRGRGTRSHLPAKALDIVATRFPGSIARVKSSIDVEGTSAEDLAA